MNVGGPGRTSSKGRGKSIHQEKTGHELKKKTTKQKQKQEKQTNKQCRFDICSC